MTNIEKVREFVDWLTHDVRAIFQVVQAVLIHDGWVKSYGVEFNDKRRDDFTGLGMEKLLEKAIELGGASLSIPCGPESRVIGCCREFATLITAFLRAKGIPARSRCGFAAYFDDSEKWEDHCVCEYWDTGHARWALVDPQMDPFQQSTLSLSFSPPDIPRQKCLPGGEAWKACRDGKLNPDDFGIGDDLAHYGRSTLYGLWFVRGNLMRDFASLNKEETVPLLMRLWRDLSWTSWRLVGASDDELTDEDLALLDRIAELTVSPDECFDDLRSLYDSDTGLQSSDEILIMSRALSAAKRLPRPLASIRATGVRFNGNPTCGCLE